VGADSRGYREAVSVLFNRPRAQITPGAVHLPGWLSVQRQADLVAACREWAKPPAGIRHTQMPSGGVMSVQTVCLGWHWVPYKYLPSADDVDGAPVKEFPGWLADLGREAVADAYGDQPLAAAYQPDVALINFYDGQAKMGMHVDKDERTPAPVVSLSLGASCVFRFGNAESRNRPWHDVELESGDLFVFGHQARFAYHGVLRTLPGTDWPDIGLPSGRLNITLRESGLRPATMPEETMPERNDA
jgi:alkylated DNA repair protein (DNA oxidative demethylase)